MTKINHNMKIVYTVVVYTQWVLIEHLEIEIFADDKLRYYVYMYCVKEVIE